MKLNKKTLFIFSLFIIVTGISFHCNMPVNEEYEPKSITKFEFTNPFALGTISGNEIIVAVPNGTDVTNLTAFFTFKGKKIKVDGVNQESGVTVNDFTNPLIYQVTAKDGKSKNYTVNVVQGALVTTNEIAGNLTYSINISGTSSTGGGNVTNQGSSAVTERGLCWNTIGYPTINDNYTSNGSGIGEFNVTLTNLTENTIYYVRAYAVNSQGTVYSNEITFDSGYTSGTELQGGYVFYNDGYGHGLICAMSDLSGYYPWIKGGSTHTTLNNNTSEDIGTGLANTIAITSQIGHTESAAQACLDYDDGTYSDWFLPSLNELLLIKQRLINIGGFDVTINGMYWTSSEHDADDGKAVWFFTSTILIPSKDNDYSVYTRPVRAF